MIALFWLLDELLSLYMWAVILSAVFSILTSFGVLDTRNRIVWTIGDFLYRVTEPALRPIRNMLPNFGGIDISPLILILLLQAARMLLAEIRFSVVGAIGF
jgi:YggT family protein